MKNRRATLLKLSVSTLISLLVALAVLATHGFWQTEDPAERCRLLCDAFFVPGALLYSRLRSTSSQLFSLCHLLLLKK